jgi:hypothetical protein
MLRNATEAMQLKRWRIIPCPPEVAKEASDMVRFSALEHLEWKPLQDPSRSDIS